MWRGNNVLVSKVGVQIILDVMFMTDMSQFMAEHCGPTYCSGIFAGPTDRYTQYDTCSNAPL